jgi:hypothetical protein
MYVTNSISVLYLYVFYCSRVEKCALIYVCCNIVQNVLICVLHSIKVWKPNNYCIIDTSGLWQNKFLELLLMFEFVDFDGIVCGQNEL